MRVECESSTLTPRPLFKERMSRHRWKGQASTASDHWRRMGPLAIGRGSADPRVRPNPRWPSLLIARAHYPSNGHIPFKLWCWQNFASKRCSNLFSKGFSCSKIFLDFVRNKKVLEKLLARKDVLKIQICSGKIEKFEKSKIMESKY